MFMYYLMLNLRQSAEITGQNTNILQCHAITCEVKHVTNHDNKMSQLLRT